MIRPHGDGIRLQAGSKIPQPLGESRRCQLLTEPFQRCRAQFN